MCCICALITAQVRDFIHDSLYHPVSGYFSRHASPVGRVDPPIDFRALPGREGYQRKLHELYHQQKASSFMCDPMLALDGPNPWTLAACRQRCTSCKPRRWTRQASSSSGMRQPRLCSSNSLPRARPQVAWITPSELFTPVYGAAIGAFILQRQAEAAAPQPLRIVEVGGGNGTLAKDILVCQCIGRSAKSRSLHHTNSRTRIGGPSGQRTKCCSPVPPARSRVGATHRCALVPGPLQDHVRSKEPEVYRSCGYATIEISGALAERQRQRAAASGHADRCFLLWLSSHTPSYVTAARLLCI